MHRHLSRLVMLACLLLGLVAAIPISAAESIRVLLSMGASQVVVTAPSGIVAALDQQELSFPTGVTIVPAHGGLQLDDRWLPAQRLSLRGHDEDLSVLISEPPGGVANGLPRVSTGENAKSSTPLALPGRLDLVVRGDTVQVINELDLEMYVAGVVPWEMNAAWHPDALKAQAVAARTYALYQQRANAGRDYDVVAGTQDQVYGGRHQDPRVQEVVSATRGLVLMYASAPILAAFSSTAAGQTEDAMVVWAKDLPYLKGVDCPFDAGSPYYSWRASFTLEDLEAGLRRQGISVGTIATLAPLSHSRAGRVARLRILHSGGELILRGEELRRAVGYTLVPSTLFEFEALGREVVLTGRGAGHAVGLCQWGAKELAGLGYPFSTILQYYFPGTDLVDLRSR
jgi:stage II sporulation protein D